MRSQRLLPTVSIRSRTTRGPPPTNAPSCAVSCGAPSRMSSAAGAESRSWRRTHIMADGSRVQLALEINGRTIRSEIEPRMLLVEFIREVARLTGTHVGCDTSYCGACTIALDGRAVKSCTVLAVQADGMQVTTIEGLESKAGLHPLQAAFARHHALQCG